MTNKSFDVWNLEKKKIHYADNPKFYVNKREIWYTKMGQNIGFEEDGKESFLRPVLVLKKVGNLFFTVALTSNGKDNHRFYHKFQGAFFNENNQTYKDRSYVILSQVKIMDKKRFTEKMGKVETTEFESLKQKLKVLLL